MMLQASLSGLDPATTYAVVLTAFTDGGMGTGAPLSASTLHDGEYIVLGYAQHCILAWAYCRIGTSTSIFFLV